MGFFSSRRNDESDSVLTSPHGADNEKSVVNAIRSKFYGKNKGKERDEQPVSFYASASTAQTLSSSGTTPYTPATPSKLSTLTRSFGANLPRVKHDEAHMPSTSKTQIYSGSTPEPPPSPVPSWSRAGTPGLRHEILDTPPPLPQKLPPPRKTADSVSLTLAQRLNELATANSEGLLNDDEYRLLRQNLFERFSVTAAVPTEPSVVPVRQPRSLATNVAGERKPQRPISSNFQVGRTESIRSKGSVSSGVASILRLATNRRTPSGSRDYSETSSIRSTTSKSSNFFRRVSRKSSNSSIHTTTSRQHDPMPLSSRQPSYGPSPIDRLPHLSPLASRSTPSIRKMATPPSSFPSRIIGNESSRQFHHASDVFDDDHPKSASELRQEILAIEAEARRLVDAFNGLEMTTLAKVQRRVHLNGDGKLSESASSWSMSHEGQSPTKRVTILDSDVASTRSGASAGTSPSILRSPQSARRLRPKLGMNSPPGSSSGLKRMNSTSSFGSQERKAHPPVPPLPTLPSAYGQMVGSASNTSLARSTPQMPMRSLGEDDVAMGGGEGGKVEDELENIRGRRAEVSGRYEVRLEFLRAQLKGAELHEKLARR